MNAGRILIVDDSEESRGLLSEILAGEGYDVRPADSGELALASVAVSPPELILLDMRMPGMDGTEVCKRLKARAESRDIPVIFLSATVDFADRLEGLAAGAVDFVNKPFRREELLARLKTHLELARLRKDLEARVVERTAQLQAANDQLKNELETRTRIEAELRESEQRFRSIADTVPAMIFMIEEARGITYVNQWALTFSGLSAEQLSGGGYLPMVHPDDVQGMLDTLAEASREQKRYTLECRFRRSDGEYRWLATIGNPRFVRGEFVGHIGVVLDFTELKRTQEGALANQKIESVGMLTAGVAHTFNNLVSTILAHSDLALEDVQEDTPAYESLTAISVVALRASEIVGLLMAYAGQSESETFEPVELSAVIPAMVQLLKASAPRVPSLNVKLLGEPTLIWANLGQIRQVVLNLLVNAAEALDAERGTISVFTSKVRGQDRFNESGAPDLAAGDYVLLEITDTGHGMTEEVRTRIFDPFYSTKSLGRGLGLASVQGMVRGAGGAISVTSAPGKGSTFKVWWPVWRGASRENGHGQWSTARTVLLVHDDDTLRLEAMRALQREGYSVMAAGDGLAASELFERHFREIEAVILDPVLPGFSGQPVRDEIRRLKPDIRVLFTSAEGVDDSSEASNGRFLPEPYRVQDLLDAIRKMMPLPERRH